MPPWIPDFALPAAHAFLRSFPAPTAERGEAYFLQGAVRDVEALEEETGFSARVTGSRVYEVDLLFEPKGKEWHADCTCPVEASCKHGYALMKHLLVEASRNAPQASPSSTPPARTWKRPAKAAPEGLLAVELASVLGRTLLPDEAEYLQRVSAAFAAARANRGMFVHDFAALGFRVPGFSWDRVVLWPEFPADEREFWRYLVLFIEPLGLTVPDFMKPVSEPGPLRETVAQWRRTREVERWSKLFSNLDDGGATATQRVLDLRLRFEREQATVEASFAGDPEFTPMKPAEFRKLPAQAHSACTPEAALLCQWLSRRAEDGWDPWLRYAEREASAIIAEILRVPWLASRMVAQDGAPLARPDESLRWELAPAAEEDDDYRLRLVQPDGAPAGPFLCVSPGTPTLYVTETAVWPGPPTDEHALTPGEETRIPAPALESGHGVRFLRGLGVELPERVRERVRTVAIRAVLRCGIQPTWPGAKEESCIIEASAESEDGVLRRVFTPQGWRRMAEEPPLSEHTFYDQTPLALLPSAVEALPLKWDEHRAHWHFKVTRKFAETFSAWLKLLPPELTVELRDELSSFQNDAIAGTVRLEVEEAGVDWFDLRVVLDVSETELSQDELKLLLDARGGWVRLGKKGWRRLEFKLTEEDDEQLARLGLSARDLSSEPQRLHALQLADKAARRFLPAAQCERIEVRVAELQARVTPEIPATIQAELRPYQREGFHFLAYLSANNFGGILADDMGLGKTLQTLTWLAWLREKPGAAGRPALVVCPKSVADNWRAECERFMPSLRVRVWHASDLAKLPKETASADLHVINYAQLRSVGEAIVPFEFLAVILDEGQFIKNPTSATAQIARALRTGHRVVLSGTPIENRLLDLWSLMSFAMPGALGSRAQFGKLYDAKEDPFARRRLTARVRPFVLRRTKAQVARDLPDRIEEDLYCELEGEQKTLYRAELKRAQQMLLRVATQQQLAKQRFHVLTSLLRLRQICCHPRLVKPESTASSAKLEALLEQLEPLMEEGQKVLVFSQFVEMLNLLRGAVTERQWPHFYLAGDTENRGDIVRAFQAAPGPGVFLISLKAGGFGLNLTAASYVVLFDPWWNPAVENQAIDRTHRIGQANKVIAYRLLIKGSVEEKIRALQKTKRALADDVLGEEQFAQSLTLDDLRTIFAE